MLFCSQNIKDVDYKEIELLRRFVSGQSKIIDPDIGNLRQTSKKIGASDKKSPLFGIIAICFKIMIFLP